MSWVAVGGAAVSVAGSMISANNQPTLRWKPMSNENLWGTTSFDKKNKTIKTNLSDWAQGVSGGLQDQASQLGGSPLFGMGQGMQQQAALGAGDLYAAAQAYGLPPEVLFQSAMGGSAGVAGGLGNLFGQAANNPYAQQQMALGMNFLGAQPKSYNDVYAQRLGLLREQAAPFEERAQNSLMTKLYSMGQLGTPGGERGMESFARGLGQADTGRQLDAMGLSEQLYGRDLSAALQQQGMGANLFSGGVSNYFGGLGMAGQLGQAAQGAYGNMYDLGVNWNQLGLNRADARLARAGELFGFGTQVGGAPTAQQASIMNLLSGMTAEQQKQAEMGLAASGPQGGAMQAGGNTFGQSAGAALTGAAPGIGAAFGNWMNRPTATGTVGPMAGGYLGGNMPTSGGGGGFNLSSYLGGMNLGGGG